MFHLYFAILFYIFAVTVYCLHTTVKFFASATVPISPQQRHPQTLPTNYFDDVLFRTTAAVAQPNFTLVYHALWHIR